MNQNINKEFEDKSWDAMRALLDREMPEGGVLIPPVATNTTVSKDGKKRYGLWAFFMGATCLVTGLAWYALSKNILTEKKAILLVENKGNAVSNGVKKGQNIEERNPDSIGAEGSKIFVIPAKEESESKTPSFAHSDSSFLGMTKVPLGVNSMKKSKNTEGGKAGISTSNFNENKVLTSIDTVKKGKNVFANDSAATEGGVVFAISTEEEFKAPSFAHPDSSFLGMTKETTLGIITGVNKNSFNAEKLESVNDKIKRLTDLPYDFLPLAKASIIDIRDTNIKVNFNALLMGKIICVAGKTNTWRWGITTGAHTEGVKKFDGFQAGLFLSKKWGQKWAIQTGLNYRRNTAQGDSMNFVQLENKAATAITTASPASNTFNLAQGKEIKLKNLNYLELPVTIQYAFHRKFSAFTGIKATYLLSNSVTASDNSKWYVVNNARDQVSAKASSNSTSNTYVQGSTAQYLGLNRWDGAIIGGVSYSILPKMTVSLRYDYGFKNILNQQNWKAYNRYLGLNLNYNF
jgi:hypothetical protein